MDIGVDVFFSALLYLLCGALIGGLFGWALTYLWFNPEQRQLAEEPWPPPIKCQREAMQIVNALEKRGQRL